MLTIPAQGHIIFIGSSSCNRLAALKHDRGSVDRRTDWTKAGHRHEDVGPLKQTLEYV